MQELNKSKAATQELGTEMSDNISKLSEHELKIH